MAESCGYFRQFGAVVLVLMNLLPMRAHAQRSGRPESEVKALFFVTLARYTEWPTNAFASETSPIVIGVLGGENPFGPFLQTLTTDEVVRGRKLEIQRYSSADEIKTCHLLYVTRMSSFRLEVELERLKGRPILTVSDSNNFIEHGGMIEIYLNPERKIRFKIGENAVTRAGLTLSPSLKRLTERAGFRLLPPMPYLSGLVHLEDLFNVQCSGEFPPHVQFPCAAVR